MADKDLADKNLASSGATGTGSPDADLPNKDFPNKDLPNKDLPKANPQNNNPSNESLAHEGTEGRHDIVRGAAATPGDQSPADPPKVDPSAQTFRQATTREDDDTSEWTVSDTRGPLHRAEEGEAGPRRESSANQAPPESDEGEWTASDSRIAHPAPDADGVAETPAATPASGPGEAAPSQPVPAYLPEERRPIWPLAAALLIGAVIGAGSAALVYRSSQGDGASDLAARVDALEKRADPQASVADLKASVADLDAKVAAIGKGGTAPAPDLGPLEQKIAGLQSNLAALKQSGAGSQDLASKIAALEGAVAGMKTQAASAQAGVSAVQGEQKNLAGKVMVPALAVVADSLVQQIDQGQPFKAQVDALAALGADPVKIGVLRQNAEQGVPSAKILATKFEALAGPIAASAHKAPANAGFVDRLKSGMFSMVSVRRVDDTSGDDPASRVARIKADLAHDDVADALATWDALPADAKAKGEGWAALVKAHAEAMAAARALQHESIAALAAKKS